MQITSIQKKLHFPVFDPNSFCNGTKICILLKLLADVTNRSHHYIHKRFITTSSTWYYVRIEMIRLDVANLIKWASKCVLKLSLYNVSCPLIML